MMTGLMVFAKTATEQGQIQIVSDGAEAAAGANMPEEQLFVGTVITGWGVIRDQPWAFAGCFQHEADARAAARAAGPDYRVRYGQRPERRPGFKVFTDAANAPA
jgi:hypothetical protein